MRKLLLALALSLGMFMPVSIMVMPAPAAASGPAVQQWGGGEMGMVDSQPDGYPDWAPAPTVMAQVLIPFGYGPSYPNDHTPGILQAVEGNWLTDRDVERYTRLEVLIEMGFLGPEMPYGVPPS